MHSPRLHVRLVECNSGNIGECRSCAYDSGNAPYFGWIDADDILLNGAYDKLFHIIDQCSTPFTWMNELKVTLDQYQRETLIEVHSQPHHIHLIHRDIVDVAYMRDPVNWQRPEAWLARNIPKGVHLNEVGYIWRRRTDGISVTNFKR